MKKKLYLRISTLRKIQFLLIWIFDNKTNIINKLEGSSITLNEMIKNKLLEMYKNLAEINTFSIY